MKLSELTPKERNALADEIGCNASYLYQISTYRRRASWSLAKKLVAARPELDVDDLLDVAE